jgi:hypothetical protein
MFITLTKNIPNCLLGLVFLSIDRSNILAHGLVAPSVKVAPILI